MMKLAPIIGCIIAFAVVLNLLVSYSDYNSFTVQNLASTRLSSETGFFRGKDTFQDVHNKTLGFQEIFVISLPERTDRRDAITLQASVTDMSVTFVDAVMGEDVPKKAWPHTMTRRPAEVGCWRSHLNVMEHMVENQIQTALIMEDDADWDVSLKSQLVHAAQGARWLLHEEGDSSAHSPYGDKWDVLWIGHVGADSDRARSLFENRRWVVPKDPTVTPPGTRSIYYEPDMSPWETGPEADPQTRIFFISGLAYGAHAWAFSLKGAEKVLYEASLTPFNEAIDTGVGEFCRHRKSNLTCIAPFPSIVGLSKPAGPVVRGSDIQKVDGEVRAKAESVGTMFSTRLNLKRILNYETEYESSYPNITGDYMSLEQISDVKGYGWTRPKVDAK